MTDVLIVIAVAVVIGGTVEIIHRKDWPWTWLRSVAARGSGEDSLAVEPRRSRTVQNSGHDETDVLFDTTDEAMQRHVRKLDPQQDVDYWSDHARFAILEGWEDSTEYCAKKAAHWAFQLRPDLKPPIVQRVRVLTFRQARDLGVVSRLVS